MMGGSSSGQPVNSSETIRMRSEGVRMEIILFIGVCHS